MVQSKQPSPWVPRIALRRAHVTRYSKDRKVKSKFMEVWTRPSSQSRRLPPQEAVVIRQINEEMRVEQLALQALKLTRTSLLRSAVKARSTVSILLWTAQSRHSNIVECLVTCQVDLVITNNSSKIRSELRSRM